MVDNTERELIVVWLRARRDRLRERASGNVGNWPAAERRLMTTRADVYATAADAIERGDHWNPERE